VNQWFMKIEPKPIPFYENHLEPWGGSNEEQINSTILLKMPQFIFAAVAGRKGNDQKKVLVAEAVSYFKLVWSGVKDLFNIFLLVVNILLTRV
jgi:hypothetical protein